MVDRSDKAIIAAIVYFLIGIKFLEQHRQYLAGSSRKWAAIGFLCSFALTWLGCNSAPTTELAAHLPAAATMTLPPAPATATETAVSTTTSTPIPTATATTQPTNTATPTLTPTATITPTATLIPTPVNLPRPPTGWQWEFYAAGIPVTHYITHEIRAGDYEGATERPYGLDNQPMPELGMLPHTFLLETAYQGSGLLPNGDLLQYADTRAPIEPNHVPFRFLITPQTICGGYPVAGNRTCSIPFQTAATTANADGEFIPVGSTIFVVELNSKIYVNDTAFGEGPDKLDLYTGYIDNYNYDRPKGAEIWILRPLAQ